MLKSKESPFLDYDATAFSSTSDDAGLSAHESLDQKGPGSSSNSVTLGAVFLFIFFSLGLLVPSFIPLLGDVDPQMAGRVHLSLREIANESQTSVLPRFCL